MSTVQSWTLFFDVLFLVFRPFRSDLVREGRLNMLHMSKNRWKRSRKRETGRKKTTKPNSCEL